ncbi:hypothetical protein N0V82_006518 [Gnomoniopsis sp. IMI 355080]|nr:hypothetical protein N0V82_006518 [Gnomoniopsis sp. IMI 355080]
MLLGTNTHDDLRVVRHIIEANGSIDGLENLANRTSKFQLHYSLAHWLLVILEVTGGDCNRPNSILEIQEENRKEPTLQPLRDFVTGKITWDVGNFKTDPTSTPEISAEEASTTGASTKEAAADEDENASITSEEVPAPPKLTAMIKDAFKRTTKVGEVLFITTGYANSNQWKQFVGSAKTVILEEALLVWRNLGQNVILVGGLKQLKPWTRRRFNNPNADAAAEPAGDTDDISPEAEAWNKAQETTESDTWGNTATESKPNTWGGPQEASGVTANAPEPSENDDAPADQGSLKSNFRFESYILTSVMAHFILQGEPVLPFTMQYRAINGQHDPVLDIMYKALPFTYHKSRDPQYHPDALKIEDVVSAVFEDIRPSPPGKIYPVMVDVPGSLTEIAKSKSKFNVMQGEVGKFS